MVGFKWACVHLWLQWAVATAGVTSVTAVAATAQNSEAAGGAAAAVPTVLQEGAAVKGDDNHPADLLPDRIFVNKPSWYDSKTGQIRKAYPQHVGTLKEEDYPSRYWEDRVIMELMFPESYSGLIVEIGAVDGVLFSSSQVLEHYRGWRSVLVEGDPVLAKYMADMRSDALSVNAIVCHNWGVVQFAPMGTQGGIVETMPRHILWNFHPYLLYDRGNGDLTEELMKEAQVPTVGCVPLGWLLTKQLKLKGADVLMIDINGAEWAALTSIDFDSFVVDIVAINVDERRADTTPKVREGCEAHMNKFGYHAWQPKNLDKALQKHHEWVKDVSANRLLYFVRKGSLPASKLLLE